MKRLLDVSWAQELVYSQRQLIPVGQPMEAYVALNTTPVCLDGICTGSGIWVDKVLTVIYSAVMITQLGQSRVSTPFIGKIVVPGSTNC